MCHTVTQCDTVTQKMHNMQKIEKICQLGNEIDVRDSLRHCDTSVTPKVIQIHWTL
jgi:hypothetical protein